MTPELRLILENMHGDIRAIDVRTREIETSLATKHGSATEKRGLVETMKWAAMLAVAALTGHVAGQH